MVAGTCWIIGDERQNIQSEILGLGLQSGFEWFRKIVCLQAVVWPAGPAAEFQKKMSEESRSREV
jgi:hypothetical protein